MNFRAISMICALAGGLAGCYTSVPDPKISDQDAKYLAMVPNFDTELEFKRALIDDNSGEAPGTIIVDTKTHHLYFVMPNKKAIRYGVATGAEAQGWTGVATIQRKAEWPRWMPPAEMIGRWPHLKPTYDAGGLPGGPDNPLGARAMYLFQNNKDTLYRIHGTNEPETIGHDVSSGCIRLANIDAIDLFNRVQIGAKVIVK